MAVDWDALVLAPLEGIFADEIPFTFIPRGSAITYEVKGVFDRGYLEIVMNEDTIPLNESQPVLGVRQALFDGAGIPIPKQSDRFNIRGVGYIVKDVQPDSHGNLKVLLNAT